MQESSDQDQKKVWFWRKWGNACEVFLAFPQNIESLF